MNSSETFIHAGHCSPWAWVQHNDCALALRRNPLFPLGLGTALSLMGDATLYTVLPTHTAEAGIALSSVGIILGVNRVVRLFLNGPAGLAYDRWPRRWLFVPALFIGSLSTTVYAATRGSWPMLKGVTDNGNRIQRKQARASARAHQPAFTGL